MIFRDAPFRMMKAHQNSDFEDFKAGPLPQSELQSFSEATILVKFLHPSAVSENPAKNVLFRPDDRGFNIDDLCRWS